MSPEANRCPVDRDRINDAAGGDPEFLEELVEIFLDDAQERIRELRALLLEGNAVEFGRKAHMLKGSSANVGAVGLADLAKHLERMGSGNALEEAPTLVEQMEREYDRVRADLEDLVG